MSKLLTKEQVISRFKVVFLPNTNVHANDRDEVLDAWDYYKQGLFKENLISGTALEWKLPNTIT